LDGENDLYWTRVGEDHVPIKTRLIEDVKTYLDYPREKHPIECFAEFLTEMGLAKKRIGIDNKAGASAMWGYEVPTLTRKLPDAKFVDMACSKRSFSVRRYPKRRLETALPLRCLSPLQCVFKTWTELVFPFKNEATLAFSMALLLKRT